MIGDRFHKQSLHTVGQILLDVCKVGLELRYKTSPGVHDVQLEARIDGVEPFFDYEVMGQRGVFLWPAVPRPELCCLG